MKDDKLKHKFQANEEDDFEFESNSISNTSLLHTINKQLSAMPTQSNTSSKLLPLPELTRKGSYDDTNVTRLAKLIPTLKQTDIKVDLENKPLFIGVAGGTASGKTTVCEIIKEEFGDFCCMVAFDMFYKGLSDEDHKNAENYNFDSPNALDFDLAYDKICSLLKYEDVKIPVYDFTLHKRKPNEFEQLRCQPLLIFEGIFALYEQRFRDLFDLSIFVLTDDDIRLSRRITRDTQERGRRVEEVLGQYNRFVKKSYDEFIKPTMKYADIIVPKGKENRKGIEFIINNLKLCVPQDDIEKISAKGGSTK